MQQEGSGSWRPSLSMQVESFLLLKIWKILSIFLSSFGIVPILILVLTSDLKIKFVKIESFANDK